MSIHYDIIKKPLFTEKGARQAERQNTFAFEVHPGANKIEIKQAIEAIFEVSVVKVRTVNQTGKLKRVGWNYGRTPPWKKALVTLKEGDTIQLA
ncbi:MAG: 50S ribosomal protein L23 [Planctomycetota bacterium]